MTQRFRETLSWLHTWSGLVLGLVVVMLAVTGAGLVLQPELDSLVNRPLLAVPACTTPLPLDKLAAIAGRAYPAGTRRAIEITQSPTASIAVDFFDDTQVYLNPCSGRVLGIKNQYSGFFGTLDWLHRFRFVGHPDRDHAGKVVAGLVDVGFALLLIVGGLVLWWPRGAGEARNAFAFQWRRRGSARTLSLHKIVGLYTVILTLIITLTALPIAFQPLRNVIAWATQSRVDSSLPPRLTAPAHATPLSMQALWQRAQARIPDTVWATLYYPAAHSAVAKAEILERDAPHKNAKSYLYLNAYSGRTVEVHHYSRDTPEGRKIYLYLLALHSGLIGGLPYQLLLLIAALGIPVQAYSGASVWLRRKFRAQPQTALALRLKLVRKAVEAEGICSFEFADPDGAGLPPFSAGSHIAVDTGGGLIRHYSLCNDPKDTHRYVIAVHRHPESRGGSRAMHENLAVGGVVNVDVPRNHFPLAHAARRSLLIAAGIGITPILCMAERLSNSGADFALHYCFRTAAQAAFLDRIAASDFAGHTTLHNSSEDGRLDVARLLAGELRDVHIYVCGPAGFMDAVIATAREMDWDDALIHREYFAGAGHDASADTPFDVRIASTGETVHVPCGETVVAALARFGVEIPVSCAEGVCGTCLTRVLEGDIAHYDAFLTPEEREKNDQFTPCCSRARSPLLVLDL